MSADCLEIILAHGLAQLQTRRCLDLVWRVALGASDANGNELESRWRQRTS